MTRLNMSKANLADFDPKWLEAGEIACTWPRGPRMDRLKN